MKFSCELYTFKSFEIFFRNKKLPGLMDLLAVIFDSLARPGLTEHVEQLACGKEREPQHQVQNVIVQYRLCQMIF